MVGFTEQRPVAIMNTEAINYGMNWDELDANATSRIAYCTGSLFFLSLLLLSGLAYSFNEMAGWNEHRVSSDNSDSYGGGGGGGKRSMDREEDHIDREQRIFSATPNGRWIFIICGLSSVISDYIVDLLSSYHQKVQQVSKREQIRV